MAEYPNGFVCNGPTSSPDENELPSGFPPNICDDVPEEKYLCSFCKNVLKKAHQTLCGHRYCWACVDWIVRCNKTPICQKCKEDDPQSMNDDSILSLEKVFSDAAVSKEILDLKVHCINPGCTWKDRMKNYEDHMSQCEYSLIPCSTGCGLMVLRKKLADHLERECKNNMNECQLCNLKMFMKDMQEHLCEEISIKEAKPFKDEPTSREQSRSHGGIQTRDKCCFAEIGCTFRGGKELLKDHMNSSVTVHLNLLLQFANSLKNSLLSNCSLANGDDEAVSAVALMHSRVQQLEKRMSFLCLQSSVLSLQSQVPVESNGGLECDGADGASYSGSLSDLPLALCSGETLTECQSKITGLERKIQTFENIVTVLNREVEKAQTTMGAFERQSKLDQDIVKNLERKVTDQQHLLALKDVLLNELRMQILALEDVSYDGIFMWKITDFTRKRQEAIAGRITSLYSPAFYTSRYGYKVRMRVYLNGDGAGRGSYISLFFVMMRGGYDALLQWPFKQKVTFMLLDQNNREHVIDAFRPDLNSSSFQRPVNEMNIASGCPMFFSLCKLDSPKQAYVKDETLFIKCIIDTPS